MSLCQLVGLAVSTNPYSLYLLVVFIHYGRQKHGLSGRELGGRSRGLGWEKLHHCWDHCFSQPQIANEAPPLREIPHDCRPETADVIKAGLVKDPIKRASAKELREKTIRALQEGESLLPCSVIPPWAMLSSNSIIVLFLFALICLPNMSCVWGLYFVFS